MVYQFIKSDKIPNKLIVEIGLLNQPNNFKVSFEQGKRLSLDEYLEDSKTETELVDIIKLMMLSGADSVLLEFYDGGSKVNNGIYQKKGDCSRFNESGKPIRYIEYKRE